MLLPRLTSPNTRQTYQIQTETWSDYIFFMPSSEMAMLHNLHLEILQRRNEMNEDEVRKFQDRLITLQEKCAKVQHSFWSSFYDSTLTEEQKFQRRAAQLEYVEKKIMWMQNWLRRSIESANKSVSSSELKINDDRSHENDQPATAVNLNSLLQKQKFYIQMIDSLVPEGEISSKKAELQYEHVSQLYERFVSNQSEITTLIKDDEFNDQVKISKDVQDKVLSLQETLKEIFSPTKPTILSESKVNEHFNRTDRPNVIVDFLDSQYMKQKSLIEQIELIESKKDPSAAEAETLHNHVSQLYDSFIKNQAKIETYVKGPALDKELIISREILVKVMSIQTKLKEIFTPVGSQSKPVDESKQMKESDKVIYLNSLLEKQKSLINEINSITSNFYSKEDGEVYFVSSNCNQSVLQFLPKLKTWFVSNQTKIEELVDDFDLYQQKKISIQIQKKLADIQDEYVSYLE